MRIVILTSNSIRHKFFANTLTSKNDKTLVISEYKQSESIKNESEDQSLIKKHFRLRDQIEEEMFPNNDSFIAETLSIPYKDINQDYIYQKIEKFQPDIMFIFGSSIIREPLLSFTYSIPTFNLHLGLSPYYRGSGTNFWPFVNKELEYVGSTILRINSGIDTGDIICHTRPKIELGDNAHTIGCKVVQSSVNSLIQIKEMIKNGRKLNSVKQWIVEDERYYRTSDFNEEVLLKYKNNLENNLIENYISKQKKKIKLIKL